MTSSQLPHHLLDFISLFPLILISVAAPWYGRSHRGILFGVTVPVDFTQSPTAQSSLDRYLRNTTLLAIAVIGLAALLLATGPAWLAALSTAIVLPLELFGVWLFWHRENSAIRPYAVTVPLERTADLTPRDSHTYALFAAAAAFLPLAFEALWLHLHWDLLPARWPQHWNAAGQINGWGTRTVGSVYGPLLGGVPVILILVGVVAMMAFASGTQVKQRQRFLAPLIALTWSITFMFCFIGLLPVAQPIGVTAILTVVCVHMLVVLAIVIWGMWRAGMAFSTSTPEPYDGTPDSGWRAGGLIYFNPADAAVMVPKRFGWGWTLNMARPLSWIYLGAVLLFVVGMIVISLVLK